MPKKEEKQIVLVTGASSGMGKDFAKNLAKQGYIVYAVARNIQKMSELRSLGAITMKMDITKDEDIIKVVNKIKKEHGRLDVLINSAGFGLYGAMEDISISEAKHQFEVNLFGLARLTQLVLPMMRAKKSGKIINISSIGGKIYTPLGSWYHASKHALEGWSDCLRIELKNFNINVIIIEPGFIETNFGTILIGPMIGHSGKGAYKHLVNGFVKSISKFEKIGGSDPHIITKIVLKAIKSKNPKTRYHGGKLATQLLLLRATLTDKMFDKMIEKTFFDN